MQAATYVRTRLRISQTIPLGVMLDHVLAVGQLPDIHRDPFDRLLVAQAHVENMTIVTADRRIARYNVLVHDAGSQGQNRGIAYTAEVRSMVAAAFMAVGLALAGCGGSGTLTFPGEGSCLFSGVTQLVYPIPNATNVPDALSQVVFASSQLFPYSFEVLINNDPNPGHAKRGTAAFFQRIGAGQVPTPSAPPTLSNPYYESATLSTTFPHGTYYVFLNDSQVSCTPTQAGSFTTQ